MATSRLMPLHIGKGRTASTAVSDIIDYVENPEKTDHGRLISCYACDSRTADNEFILAKQQYAALTGRDQGSRDVLAYHIRQSFKPGTITPEEANEIGYELAMRFTKGKHAFVVCTHIDKEHVHSHIIFNSTDLDCSRKFRNFWGSAKAVRRISDILCVEHGLSIIENPKPSRGHYGSWLGDNKKPSYQEQIRQAIDWALEQKPVDFDSFLKLIESTGIEVNRERKNLRFRTIGQEKYTRCDTLKGDYTEQAILERIDGRCEGSISSSSRSFSPALESQKLSLLIDIEQRIQAGKGAGYERWAKVFNLKQAAQTLIFLQENGFDDYEALAAKAEETTVLFSELSMRVNTLDKELKSNADLQKTIVNYSKTRDTYVAYRKAGYSKKFRAEHESEIIIHQAAKKVFDDLGYGKDKKIPTVATLRSEYDKTLAEKKKAYAEYRKAKQDMKDILTAKENVDRLLNVQENPHREHHIELPPL